MVMRYIHTDLPVNTSCEDFTNLSTESRTDLSRKEMVIIHPNDNE